MAKKTAKTVKPVKAAKPARKPVKKIVAAKAPKAVKKYVYAFANGKADGDRTMKDVLGGKGSGLAEMTNAGLPVPPGFTISTGACNLWYAEGRKLPQAIEDEMTAHVRKLEQVAGSQFGSTSNPLLVSVRSGAKFSMPGMMDTILNLGLNDAAVEGLKARTSNGRFAYDSYRRFIQMFGNVVLEIPKEKFEHEFEAVKHAHGAKVDTDLAEQGMQETVARYKKLVQKETGKPFPQDPVQQLKAARDAVFRSWNNDRAIKYRRMYDIPDHIGTAVNVQKMVFGNSGERSATGVGFTRNPATGENKFFGEFLVNAQGEDVVAGVRTPRQIDELADVMPKAYKELRTITARLEKHYNDIQDFEFTIEDETLYMLQTRSGKRTGYAAVVIATDFVAEKRMKPKDALLLVEPAALSQLLSPVFDPAEWKKLPVATKGLPASPGAASGQVVFTSEQAVAWTEQGKKVLLVRKETAPDDIHGMEVAQGILTATGGMTSHAAVVGRQMGRPSVVGASALRIDEKARVFTVGDQILKEGDWLSFDGLTGEVKIGQVATKPSEILQVLAGKMKPAESDIYRRFSTLLGWADKVRTLGIRANADQPDQSELAYAFGARGIGLCRTEHMFFGEGRIEKVQRMILADNEKDRRAALAELLPLQRADFYGVFKAMHGEPVTIRTIDPPLHEFLPKREDLMVEIAKLEAKGGNAAELAEKKTLLHRVEQLHEFNPMLVRGGVPAGEGRPQGHAGSHDPAGRPRQGAARPEDHRRPRRRRGHEGAEDQDQVPRRHDDRSAARGADGGRDRPGGAVLLVRHERPDADDLRVLARRHRQVPGHLPGAQDPRSRPVPVHRHRRRGPARGDGGGEGAEDAARHQARHLRRARRRPVVDPLLPQGGPEVRQLLALPRARGAAGGGARGAVGEGGGLTPGGWGLGAGR
ncbi:MAG: pyruvate, phosphate dikinase [Vicinamibacterales bacterium]|nr:pyruvate, phosphate dikinase [Vicinamibacterales bacterium]